MSAIGKIKNGHPVGLWKNFHENGNLKSIGKWKHNMLDSTWLFYFSNGLLKQKIQYNNGIKNGFSYTYKLTNDSINYLYKKELYIEGKLHDKQTFYYPNGAIKEFINYTDGKKTDFSVQYDSLGKPVGLKTYRNNKPVSFQKINQKDEKGKKGTWIEVDDNYRITKTQQYQEGTIIENESEEPDKTQPIRYSIEGLQTDHKDSLFSGQFINEIPVGRHLTFDENGNPQAYIIYDSTGNKLEEGKLKNNKLHGTVKGFYLTGNTKYFGAFQQGLKHGNWEFFYENGKIEQLGTYYYNKPHGKWVWFYKNHDTLRIEHYKQGKLDGLYISYDPYGNIIQKGIYYDNQKQELWVENSASVQFKGKYFDGERDGLWTGTYNSGEKAFYGKYIRGKKTGKHIYYYSNGQPRQIEFYNFGKPVKHWQYFDREGNLYKVKTYKKGETLFYK